jgi:hypothetical protein
VAAEKALDFIQDLKIKYDQLIHQEDMRLERLAETISQV